jgi:steroid delta-isomerase-like uncharacterized protein
VSALRNREVVLRFFEAYNQRDEDVLRDCLAEGLVSHAIPEELGRGREALLEFLQLSFDAFPDLRNDVLDVVVDGDLVAVRTGVRGTHRHEFLGIPASGNTLALEDAHFFRFDDAGRVVEHWNYYDNLAVLQQLGVLPEDLGS